jgi:hypothetical protein
VVAFLIAACGGHHETSDAPPVPDAPAQIDAGPPDAPPDVYADVYAAVDQDRLMQTLRELTGYDPVTVGGETFSISERFSDVGRQHFLAYWRATMEGLGLTVRAIDYQDPDSARPGHDLEALLPGASPDSIIVIVHYDSIGPPGMETDNPGVDDDMTGMAILIETARILVGYQGHLAHTVRFVASDEEELGGLAGARAYASLIQGEATAGGFALVAGIDDEQSGWNCRTKGLCFDQPPPEPVFDAYDCGDSFSFPALGDQLAAVVAQYSTTHLVRDCIGANSDHYALWEIGVPSIVFTEHSVFANPHFDQQGDDTLAHIDPDYLTTIARPGITFQAQLVGIAL